MIFFKGNNHCFAADARHTSSTPARIWNPMDMESGSIDKPSTDLNNNFDPTTEINELSSQNATGKGTLTADDKMEIPEENLQHDSKDSESGIPNEPKANKLDERSVPRGDKSTSTLGDKEEGSKDTSHEHLTDQSKGVSKPEKLKGKWLITDFYPWKLSLIIVPTDARVVITKKS